NGPGRGLAAEALAIAERQRQSFDAVVSTGFCGSLSGKLKPGDMFVASRVRPIAGEAEYPAELPDTSHGYSAGTLVTADRVIDSANEKKRLSACADAVDMEASAVAEEANRWRAPFYCVRVVTDGAEESFACDFNAARRADGRISGWKVLAGALGRPGARLPELWRLRRRSRVAAGRLGAFLADCRF
ncbi:MAG: hypothetical protein GY953_19960, partial [bacterium]|nr:hypothetical protein [bacterium]